MSNATAVKDLWIKDGDLVLDSNGEPLLLSSVEAVAQDLKHKITESNLLFFLIGERNPDERKLIYKKIKLIIENDERIKAGTVKVNEPKLGDVAITANALNGQNVEII